MGPKTIAIATPSYKEGDLQSSSIILASSVRKAPQSLDRLDQYVLGDLKVVPMVNPEYEPDQNLIPYVQIYNVAIDQATLEPSIEVTYTLKREGKVVAEVKDLKGSTIQLFSGERVVLLAQIPLENIAPGDYTLEITVQDDIANRSHKISTDFKVVEPKPQIAKTGS